MPKGTNYSLEEVDNLLELIDEILPLSVTQWEKIAEHHLSRYPDRNRSVDSIKRKFKELYSKKIPTGDPNCPQEVRRAKRLRRQIINSMNASDLNSEEEGSGSEDGDDSSSHGNSQDYDNIRDVIDPPGPPENDEAEDDVSAFLDDDAANSTAVDVPEGQASRPSSRGAPEGQVSRPSSRGAGSIASSASGSTALSDGS